MSYELPTQPNEEMATFENTTLIIEEASKVVYLRSDPNSDKFVEFTEYPIRTRSGVNSHRPGDLLIPLRYVSLQNIQRTGGSQIRCTLEVFPKTSHDFQALIEKKIIAKVFEDKDCYDQHFPIRATSIEDLTANYESALQWGADASPNVLSCSFYLSPHPYAASVRGNVDPQRLYYLPDLQNCWVGKVVLRASTVKFENGKFCTQWVIHEIWI